MNSKTNRDRWLSIQILALSIIVVIALFMWEGNKGFSLWDEGYLWYGVQRVMLGEVPIRDFMAYDPGRYYWSAALMSLWSDSGIMALRNAVAIFQALGLFVGLLLIARAVKRQDFLYLVLSAMTLAVWMFPRHKLFDISLSILSVGVLTFLVQSPTSRRYFIAGFCVGLVAVFGRNHGIYAVVGSLGVMLWLSIKRTEGMRLEKGFVLWACGVVAGFSPILLMALLVPGFADAFWAGVQFLLERGSTNLPLPVPWPWQVNFASVSFGEAVRGVLVGLFFIVIVVFGMLSIAWVLWAKLKNKQVSPILVAASFLALPYAHYAYSRADVGHLAQGIFPFLVGCLVLLATQPAKIKWSLVVILCSASFWVSCVYHPAWWCYVGQQCVSVEISGATLQVDPRTASDVGLLRKLAEQHAPNGQSVIATPFWPGAYALLKRKSPMWAIYALWARGNAFQESEIDRIKVAKPRFAIIIDIALDSRDELRFKNTNPLVYKYILDNFESIQDSPNPAYHLYKAKGGEQ